MSRSTIRNQLLINDGKGNRLPIGTGTWVSGAVSVEEQRRLSFTVGITSSTGAANGGGGGFTGTFLVQGTDELPQCNGASGTQEAGGTNRPGTNGYTGGLFWQTIPSGARAITNADNMFTLSFSDVGFSFVRAAFNVSATGSTATGSLGGSGLWNVFLTAKNG